jgi:hypothetical protein
MIFKSEVKAKTFLLRIVASNAAIYLLKSRLDSLQFNIPQENHQMGF